MNSGSHIYYTNLQKLLIENKDYVENIKNKYITLLSELTITNDITTELFLNNINKIFQMGLIIVTCIDFPNSDKFKIIGSGTILIEPKIIHGCMNVGHIEDIIVTNEMRGLGISQNILNSLKDFAKANNCYKIILNCKNEIKNVYIKNGFNEYAIQMCLYYKKN